MSYSLLKLIERRMSNMEARFFYDDVFYMDDTEHHLDKSREFITIPDGKKVVLNKSNLLQASKQCYIPISMVASNIQEIKFSAIESDADIGFFDIETKRENDEFILGYINNEFYDNPIKFLERLSQFKFIVGHAIFLFDLRVLEKNYKPYKNFWRSYTISNFIINAPSRTIPIDTLRLLRFHNKITELDLNSISEHFGYNEQHFSLDDKKAKCKQDVDKLKFIWEKANLKIFFNTMNDLLRTDACIWQNSFETQVRKQIILNKYLEKGILPYKYPSPIDNEKVGGFKKHKKVGMFENMNYYDIESAYPTAVMTNKIGIYGDNDSIFNETMEQLLSFTKNESLKSYFKKITVALIGDQSDTKNYFRNPQIRYNAIKMVNSVVEEMFDEKDTIFSNTDSAITKSELKTKSEIFNIRIKHRFEWIYVWNMDNYIGKNTEGEIISAGFSSLKKNPEILRDARNQLTDKLKLSDASQALKILQNPRKSVIIDFKNINRLKFVVNKATEEVKGDDYIFIWDRLKYGFNDLVLTREDEFSIIAEDGAIENGESVSESAYESRINKILNEYRVNKNDESR
jgi:hypothetical protein